MTASSSPSPVKRLRGGTQPLPLSRDDILAAALPILAANGVENLTIRAVAERLGISSPAVYHYVDGRDDLLDRLCELVAREVDLCAAAETPWDDAVVGALLNMQATFARYPGVAARVLHTTRHSPAADDIAAAVYHHLIDGGYDEQRAAGVLTALQHLFGGWLLDPGRSTDALEQSIRWLLAGSRQGGRMSDHRTDEPIDGKGQR